MIQKPYFVIIHGPTGVGKTDFALALAERLQGEIINADVGQFYTPLTIGTAKPAWQQSTIPHHLFDVLHEPRDFTVVQYRAALIEKMQGIWARGNIPLIVGGSGFYISSIFFPPEHIPPSPDTFSAPEAEMTWDYLNSIDPQRAAKIHPHDTYRIKRALEVWHATGKKPSEHTLVYNPPARSYIIWLDRELDDLYQRINARVVAMIEHGWIAEVEHLKGPAWEPFLLKKKLIGYDYIFHYLDQASVLRNKQQLIETIAQKTRQYAKRQRTFWKMLEKKLSLYDASRDAVWRESITMTTDTSVSYFNDLIERIKKFKEGRYL